MYKFFKEHGETPRRKFVVSAVDVNSGAYRTFNESSADPVQDIVSSAAIPFAFPYITHKGDPDFYTSDGGVAWGTNIVSAVDRCREQVDDDSQITIDVVVC